MESQTALAQFAMSLLPREQMQRQLNLKEISELPPQIKQSLNKENGEPIYQSEIFELLRNYAQ